MLKVSQLVLLLVLFFSLVGIRALAIHSFYDPLITYYKADYLYQPIPDLYYSRFYMFLTLRYLLNSFVSLGVIYVLFKNRKDLLFAAKIYVVTFVLLSAVFIGLLNYFQDNNLLIFYVRRFLIHPILLLLLVPAFYYKKLKKE